VQGNLKVTIHKKRGASQTFGGKAAEAANSKACEAYGREEDVDACHKTSLL
jgi:hypothetical protein